MALKFCSIASGSSGNCYLVKSENNAVLVDAGIAGNRIIDRLAQRDITLADIDGIFITHEHVDHVKSLRKISKGAVNAPVYGSTGTLEAVSDKVQPEKAVRIAGGQEIQVGDITVIPFSLSHDAAEPLGYSIKADSRQLTIITDTGCISDEILDHARTADALILEANHEVNILNMGSYPYSLKRRILGDMGHLSNEAAGECLCRVLKSRCSDENDGRKKEELKVALAHLSKENNTPQQAFLTIRNMLFEEDYYIDKDIRICIIPRDDVSPYMVV